MNKGAKQTHAVSFLSWTQFAATETLLSAPVSSCSATGFILFILLFLSACQVFITEPFLSISNETEGQEHMTALPPSGLGRTIRPLDEGCPVPLGCRGLEDLQEKASVKLSFAEQGN